MQCNSKPLLCAFIYIFWSFSSRIANQISFLRKYRALKDKQGAAALKRHLWLYFPYPPEGNLNENINKRIDYDPICARMYDWNCILILTFCADYWPSNSCIAEMLKKNKFVNFDSAPVSNKCCKKATLHMVR